MKSSIFHLLQSLQKSFLTVNCYVLWTKCFIHVNQSLLAAENSKTRVMLQDQGVKQQAKLQILDFGAILLGSLHSLGSSIQYEANDAVFFYDFLSTSHKYSAVLSKSTLIRRGSTRFSIFSTLYLRLSYEKNWTQNYIVPIFGAKWERGAR